jgi:hypothetical protein
MEKKNISTAKELATALYEAGLVAVKQKPNDNSDEVNKANAIGSVEKKIQAHLNADKADRLQGEYVVAYCEFFGCSADYLFGQTEIVSGNDDVRHFCEITGLSEKAVKRLIEDLPDEAKVELTQWWSEVLESNLFYGLPIEWHRMCYELGQYCTAQNQMKKINATSKKMDASDTFVETWRSMMEENYLKEAEPHAGAYFLHLNNIIRNMTEFLETGAEEYAAKNKQAVDKFFIKKLHERMDASYNHFLQHMSEE